MTEHAKRLQTRREKIRELLAAGVKVSDICRRLGCCRSTVQDAKERDERDYRNTGNGDESGGQSHEPKARRCPQCRNPIYTAECLICRVKRIKAAEKDADEFRRWWETVCCQACGKVRGDIEVGGKRFCVKCFERARKAKVTA